MTFTTEEAEAVEQDPIVESFVFRDFHLHSMHIPTTMEIEHYKRIRTIAQKLIDRGENIIGGARMDLNPLTRLLCSKSPVSKQWSRVRTFAIQGIVNCELDPANG